MNETQIRSAVGDVLRTIAPEVDLSRTDASANLQEALDIDSFDFLNLLIGLHEKTGVDIPESDYGKLRTLDALVKYVAARAGKSRRT